MNYKNNDNPTLLVAHLHFPTPQIQNKNAKELPIKHAKR